MRTRATTNTALMVSNAARVALFAADSRAEIFELADRVFSRVASTARSFTHEVMVFAKRLMSSTMIRLSGFLLFNARDDAGCAAPVLGICSW